MIKGLSEACQFKDTHFKFNFNFTFFRNMHLDPHSVSIQTPHRARAVYSL